MKVVVSHIGKQHVNALLTGLVKRGVLQLFFTAIASNITPKNFLTTITPLGPKAFSIHFNERNTTKTTIQFINIPIKIFTFS